MKQWLCIEILRRGAMPLGYRHRSWEKTRSKTKKSKHGPAGADIQLGSTVCCAELVQIFQFDLVPSEWQKALSAFRAPLGC